MGWRLYVGECIIVIYYGINAFYRAGGGFLGLESLVGGVVVRDFAKFKDLFTPFALVFEVGGDTSIEEFYVIIYQLKYHCCAFS